MTLHEYTDLEQGTDTWLDVRRGIVTASVVGQLITSRKLSAIDFPCPNCTALANSPCLSKRAGLPATPIKTLHSERAEYAKQDQSPRILEVAHNDYSQALTATLVAERITGWTESFYVNAAMQRGVDDEPRARDKYSEHYAAVTETGFMVREVNGFKLGYSPDGLVGDDGLIEIKSRAPKKQLATILSGKVPPENVAQLQAGLLVSGRQWIDYVSYAGGWHMYVKRVFPDQRWFDAITEAVEQFEKAATEMVAAHEAATRELHQTERVIELEMVI